MSSGWTVSIIAGLAVWAAYGELSLKVDGNSNDYNNQTLSRWNVQTFNGQQQTAINDNHLVLTVISNLDRKRPINYPDLYPVPPS